MQKSVFLPLLDNYEVYDRNSLHIESFSAIESENSVRISIQNSSYERSTHVQLPRTIKRNILQVSEAVGILHVLSTCPDLSKIN